MARFVLRQASTDQVTSALRKIRIAKFAVNKSAATVIVRDTKEQVETALDRIAAMERGGS
jgi:hypothetical protein